MAFRKKKNEIIPQKFDYTTTEKDFEFLTLILSRKKNITKEFLINVFSTQQSEKDFLRDEDIEPHVFKITQEVVDEIGENYKKFLTEKYFGTFENLYKFISEDVYVDIIADSISRNNKKSISMLTSKATSIISKMNKK